MTNGANRATRCGQIRWAADGALTAKPQLKKMIWPSSGYLLEPEVPGPVRTGSDRTWWFVCTQVLVCSGGLTGLKRLSERKVLLPSGFQPSYELTDNNYLGFMLRLAATRHTVANANPITRSSSLLPRESLASEQTFVHTENVELWRFSWLWTKYHLTPQCCYPLRFVARLSGTPWGRFPPARAVCGLSSWSRSTRYRSDRLWITNLLGNDTRKFQSTFYKLF